MKPQTPKKLTKKQKKALNGPNAAYTRSLNHGHMYSSRTGPDFHGVEGKRGMPLVRRRVQVLPENEP